MRCRLPLIALGLLLGACKKPAPAPQPEPGAPASSGLVAETPHRCTPVSTEPPFILGPADIGRTPPKAGRPSEPGQDDLLPFAAEVGEAVAFTGGFAVGAIHESAAALSMSAVLLDADGRNAKVVPLGTAHGDVEPPRLAASGSSLIVGALEPGPSGRTLRLARIQDGEVTWGSSIQERGGESQAFDFGIGAKKGIVVWDEDGTSSGGIQVSTFDAATAGNATIPRTISPPGTDAESPRILARAGGGYWLAYIARRAGEEDYDARYVAEDIGFRWIEVVALDANGSPTGIPLAATPRDGHVLVFDAAPAPEGGILLVWRSDDTPTGSAGGDVMRTVVRGTIVDAPSVLVAGEIGAGVPSVLNGWLAVTDAADTTRLAPLDAAGEMTGPLAAEPDIGAGEPIAGSAERLLVARPAGRAVKLAVLKCSPGVAPAH